MKNRGFFTVGLCGLFLLVAACKNFVRNRQSPANWDTLCVQVTAYNSLNYQTKTGNPAITAWGDTLSKNTKAIAVSRDLIKKGLLHDTPLKIQVFSSVFF